MFLCFRSALSSMYSSVPTLPELAGDPALLADERAASTPRLSGECFNTGERGDQHTLT